MKRERGDLFIWWSVRPHFLYVAQLFYSYSARSSMATFSSGILRPHVVLAGIALTVPSSPSWIIDTVVTHHMCSTLSLFSSYTPCSTPSSVQLPDGSNALVTHIGTVSLSSSLVLEHVFFIPSFKFNLLSVSQLINSNTCSVTFSSTHCLFQDP